MLESMRENILDIFGQQDYSIHCPLEVDIWNDCYALLCCLRLVYSSMEGLDEAGEAKLRICNTFFFEFNIFLFWKEGCIFRERCRFEICFQKLQIQNLAGSAHPISAIFFWGLTHASDGFLLYWFWSTVILRFVHSSGVGKEPTGFHCSFKNSRVVSRECNKSL